MRAGILSGTPLIRLARLGLDLWVKAEHLLPTGSVFDRVATSLVEASSAGRLIAFGSGGECVAYAAAAAQNRRDLTVVCPETTLDEHLILLDDYPCEVVLTPGGLPAARDRAMTLEIERGAVLLSDSKRATEIFATTLGAELAASMPSRATIVVPTVSTDLIAGIRRGAPNARVIGTTANPNHSIQDGLLPESEVLGGDVELVQVEDRTAYLMRRDAATREGILVGLASASAIHVARSFASAVAVIVDAGDRHFSRDVPFAGSTR